MSSQLVSIVPGKPLTDDVFPFNRDAFIQIQNHHENDLVFLSSPSTVVVGVGSATGQDTLGGISTVDSDSAAQQLVDPTKLALQHNYYSVGVKNALPPAIDAVDKFIHDFSSDAGHIVQQLYENIATQGVQIINNLLKQLADVDNALAALYEVLTKDNIQENLVVGQEKYKASEVSNQTHSLQELKQYLPIVLQTIQEVQAAFATLTANFNAALGKIKSGTTNPNLIFAQSHEEVVAAWQAFEVKRKTMTYLPYKYND